MSFSRRDILKAGVLSWFFYQKKILSEDVCQKNIKDETDPITWDENLFLYSVDGPVHTSYGRLTVFFKDPKNLSRLVLTYANNAMIESKLIHKTTNYFVFYNISDIDQYQLIVSYNDKVYRHVFDKNFSQNMLSRNPEFFLDKKSILENFYSPSKSLMTSCHKRQCYGLFFPMVVLDQKLIMQVTFAQDFSGKFYITDPVGTVLISSDQATLISSKEYLLDLKKVIPLYCPYVRVFVSMGYGGFISSILTV